MNSSLDTTNNTVSSSSEAGQPLRGLVAALPIVIFARNAIAEAFRGNAQTPHSTPTLQASRG